MRYIDFSREQLLERINELVHHFANECANTKQPYRPSCMSSGRSPAVHLPRPYTGRCAGQVRPLS